MKKILTTLLTAAMIVATPAAIFADEDPQELENPSTGTIKLIASKTSSYTVKLPKVVDVSDNEKVINIYAKGDVDASKKIMVVESSDETHYLKDDAGKKTKKKLTVTAGNGILGSDVGEDYNNDKYTTLTITHDDIAAGSWTCNLPIVIRLDDVVSE